MTWNRHFKIDILIPAHNEEDALPVLLSEIDREPVRRIVVVNNASTDRTGELAREAGCTVVDCETPGYGMACLAGIDYMRKDPPDILVFLDGDRSDHPRYLADLCLPIIDNEQDFVLGSRVKGKAEQGSLTVTQKFGNWLATTLMNFFWKTDYSDLGPFRAISWESLERLGMADTNYGWTIEMQIKAATAGLRLLEIPVDYRNRIGISKISGTVSGVIKAGYKILYTIFKYRFLAGPLPRQSKAGASS
ncbi:MAG: glycosyltransferase family 2 protein [Acidobacteriota bacterium]|nr:glycosyltransferase family 2 protein [Acidobacteriota bacterium]